jgi:hypothetical protein
MDLSRNEPPSPSAPQPNPSTQALAKTIALTLVVAGVLLVTVIVPAEYGIDPLGTGEALGLSALSGQATALESVPPPQGTKQAPTQEGAFALYPEEYKFDSREFILGPYEYVEYKYHLEQGATMLFSWRANGDVIHDLHGVPDGAPSSAEQSFDKRGRRRADGTFAAPFSGIHGWYWENPGGDTITVRVTTAGFYTSAHEFRFDRTRHQREVRALDTIALSDDEKEMP